MGSEVRILPVPVNTTDDQRQRARRAIARRVTGVSEAREVMDMLDLIPTEGETP